MDIFGAFGGTVASKPSLHCGFLFDGVRSPALDATTLGKPGASLYILLLTFLAAKTQLAMPEFGRTSPSWMLEVSEQSMLKSSSRRT